jgi:N-acetylmuramoyl-L-alanine amidase
MIQFSKPQETCQWVLTDQKQSDKVLAKIKRVKPRRYKVMSYKVIEQYLDKGHPNRPGGKLSPLKAIVFHYTGNDDAKANAAMNARYFNRAWYSASKEKFYEADKKDAFRYGSTHVIADQTSVVKTIPFNEPAWSVGDRQLSPYDGEFKGQQPLAKYLCGNRQNYNTLSIEICNNDVIPGSDLDWCQSVENAQGFAVELIKALDVRVHKKFTLNPESFKAQDQLPAGTILLLRHYDLTGKQCPKPMVDNPSEWHKFTAAIMEHVPCV